VAGLQRISPLTDEVVDVLRLHYDFDVPAVRASPARDASALPQNYVCTKQCKRTGHQKKATTSPCLYHQSGTAVLQAGFQGGMRML